MPLYKLTLLFSLIFTVVFRGHSQSQIIEKVKSTRIFLNKRENSFLLFDDSTFYYKYKIANKRWTKHSVTFKGDCNFSEFKREFLPLASEKGDIYFVYRGCGEVYQLIDDTIRRIDRSFRHENQFNGNLFMYKDKICFFGGYGLFSTKNFILTFNLKLKEWMLEDIPLKNKVPAERICSFSQQDRDYFYILGGRWSNTKEQKIFSDVWRYSFKANRWEMLGKMNAQGIKPYEWDLFTSERAQHKLIRLANNIYYIDFPNNKLACYTSDEFKLIDYPIFDATEKYICATLRKSESQESVIVYKKNELLGKPFNVTKLYEEDTPKKSMFSWLYWLSILPVSIVLFVIARYRNTNKKATTTLSKINGMYYLNGNLLSEEFSVIDEEVLMQFLLAEENTLEIADINRILEYDNATIDAVKKRREQSIKNIREKLALYGNLPAERVFLSSQHPQDRRIKRLKLNPILLQTTTK
jgi:hypothetical protein